MRVPEACVIAVGDELVTGRRRDVNGTRVGRWLEGLGCVVRFRSLVPDRESLIGDAVQVALATGAELVVITGGLGAASNDHTRQGIAQALGVALELDQKALETIETRYRERGKEVPESAPRQAYRPAGSELVPNPVGIAPGIVVDRGRSLIVALPGVPREADEMLQRTVLPRMRGLLGGAMPTRSAVLRAVGLQEADVDRRLEGHAFEPGVQVTPLEVGGEVEVLVTARAGSEEEADEQLARAIAVVEARLGDFVYGRDQDTLVAVVRDQLLRRGWKIGAAESITGGLVAKSIVDLPGSSAFFAGSLVAYSDDLKPSVLGLSEDILERCGAVSAEAARAMAEGVRGKLGAEVALATTGIAGPGGGSTDKPVGLSYLAVAWPDRTVVRRHMFRGDRSEIRSLAATAALDQVRRALLGLPLIGDPSDSSEGGPWRG